MLDKHNLHRILEVFMHTIPLFGHVSNVGEMVLEAYHKVLKAGCLVNTHEDAHITAVEHSMSKYWNVRVLYMYDIMTAHLTGHEGALRVIVRILAGE